MIDDLPSDLPSDLHARHLTEADHPRVVAVVGRWWGDLKGEQGARERALLLPRLYFQHFTDTSYVVEDERGEMVAFLVGFLSQAEPDTAYVHFVGVDPERHGHGLGRALYRAFFALVRTHGRRYVECITSPQNTGSQAFHTRMGFTTSEVKPDYDGPGLDRVAFRTDLAAYG